MKLLKSPARIAILVSLIFIIIATVEKITGATDITSVGASGATLRFTIPLLLAGLGGLWSERAGVINIGLEGMMIIGTWTGAYFGYKHGILIGMFAAAIAGLLAGFFHAFLTVKIGIDQAVSGLAINLIGLGATRFLSGIFFPPLGGDKTVSPTLDTSAPISIPGIGKFFLDLGQKNIFVISDISSILAGITTDVSIYSYFFLLLVPITTWVLWRSKFGLRVRFSGENPAAAESLGINVYRTRYIAVSISGMLASLGGAYLSTIASSVYREGQTAGRGFIGLATVIFGNWRPSGVLAGSVLFGFTDALRIRQANSVVAIVFAAGIIAALLGIYFLLARRMKVAVISFALALAATWIHFNLKEIPQEFVIFFPNLATLLILTFFAQRLTPPAMAGAPYRRGSE